MIDLDANLIEKGCYIGMRKYLMYPRSLLKLLLLLKIDMDFLLEFCYIMVAIDISRLSRASI